MTQSVSDTDLEEADRRKRRDERVAKLSPDSLQEAFLANERKRTPESDALVNHVIENLKRNLAKKEAEEDEDRAAREAWNKAHPECFD